MFVAFLLVMAFSAVSGIIFPGRCPKSPPTHYRDYRNMSTSAPGFSMSYEFKRYEVIYSIPFFVDNTSYMFRAPSMALNTIELDQEPVFSAIQLVPTMSCDFKIRTYANATKSNSSITINTTLNFANDTVICAAKSEEIRIWYEGIYVFVWSCVDRKDHSEHDQALIVGAVQITSKFNPTDVSKERTQEVKTLAKNYLTNDLIEFIDLSNPGLDLFHVTDEDLFACPKGFEIKEPRYGKMYALITISIVAAGVIGVVLWDYCKNFCKAYK